MLALAPGTGLGAYGLGEVTPQGFVWPSGAVYSQQLVRTVIDLQPLIGISGSAAPLSPPMQSQVIGLGATIQSAAGLSIRSISVLGGDILALVSAQTPIAVVAAIGDLLNEALSLAADVMEVLDVAADIVDVVPIVGQIVSAAIFIAKLFVGLVDAHKRAAAECNKQLAEQTMYPFCSGLQKAATKVSRTGFDAAGVLYASPADAFRPLAYAYWKGDQAYPPSIPSLLLMMCGGAAGDFGMTEARYQQLVKQYRTGKIPTPIKGIYTKVPPSPDVGIPYATRQKLWSILQSIMASVQNPYVKRPKKMGDQGRAMLPLAMEIMRVAYVDKGQISLPFIGAMANESLRWTRRSKHCGGGGPLPAWFVYASCIPYLAKNLATNFHEAIWEFNTQLVENFWDHERAIWLPTKRAKLTTQIFTSGTLQAFVKASANKPQGLMKLSPATLNTMFQQSARVKAAAADSAERSERRKGLLVGSTILAGGVALMGARALSKRAGV